MNRLSMYRLSAHRKSVVRLRAVLWVMVAALPLVAQSSWAAQDESAAPAKAAGVSEMSREALERRVKQLQQENAELRAENDRLRSRNKELATLAGIVPDEERQKTVTPRIVEVEVETSGQTVTATQTQSLTINAGSSADHAYRLLSNDGSHKTDAPVIMELKAWFSAGDYRKVDAVTFNIGDETYTCPVLEYDRRQRGGGRRSPRKQYDETLIVAVPADALEQFHHSRTVTGSIGLVTFELTPDQVALFRAMSKRVKAGVE